MLWLRFLPYILAAGALLGALGYVAYLRSANASLSAENASLTRSIGTLEVAREQARLAADVAVARAKAAQEAAAAKDAKLDAIRNLDLGECADALLDPALVDLLGRRGLRSDD